MHRLLTLVVMCALLCSCRREPAAAESSKPAPTTTVPDGTPEELLEYILLVGQPRYELDTILVREAKITAADKVIADPRANAEQVEQAWWNKIRSLEELEKLNSHDAADRLAELFKSSQKDPRSIISHLAKTHELENWDWGWAFNPPREEYIAAIRAHVRQGNKASFSDFLLAENAISYAEEDSSTELAIEVNREFGEFFAYSPRPYIARGAAYMLGTARRLELPGRVLELKGTLADGTPFDLESLRGKIVLIQVWTAHTMDWPPEIMMTKIKEHFAKYRDRGFDVVVVCASNNRKEFDFALKKVQPPWPVLFCDESEAVLGFHPFMVQYGITQPHSHWGMLVGRDGKVISTKVFATRTYMDGDYHGDNLTKLLEDAFSEPTKSGK